MSSLACRQRRIAGLEQVQLLFRQVLEVHQRRVRSLQRAQQLVELQLHRRAVAVLRVLNQEYHQKT